MTGPVDNWPDPDVVGALDFAIAVRLVDVASVNQIWAQTDPRALALGLAAVILGLTDHRIVGDPSRTVEYLRAVALEQACAAQLSSDGS